MMENLKANLDKTGNKTPPPPTPGVVVVVVVSHETRVYIKASSAV